MRVFMKTVMFTIVICILSALVTTSAQDIDEMQNRLEAIQEEISELENQLKTEDNRLKIETKSVGKLDKQISLTFDKISIYENNIASQKVLMNRLKSQIDSLQRKIAALQEIFREQVIFAYKYQRGKQYDWLLGASGFNDIIVKYQYFKRVSRAEQSVFEDLSAAKTTLDRKEAQLKQEMAVTREYLASASKEEANLTSRKKTKSQLISKIKKNRTLLEQSLKEKKESYQELKNILASLEKGRSSRQLQTDTQIKWEKLSGNFTRNKGKFNWPVQGKILHNFGRFKNPELKTVLDNPGIDILSQRGTPVRCIFPGVVSLITYMSGFGNTVIIDHNDGYYTVYAHLDEVTVNTGDFVEGGDRIALVGETGSLEGPKLHFEIYGNNRTLN
ncbi:MAG: hypothetical protein EH225_13630, partial [Calditrichaeota bacterium]